MGVSSGIRSSSASQQNVSISFFQTVFPASQGRCKICSNCCFSSGFKIQNVFLPSDPSLGTTLAGFGGGSGTTTYGENIGVMAATKVYSTAAYWCAAAFALILSLDRKSVV